MRDLYSNLALRFLKARIPFASGRPVKPMKLTVASTFKCNHRCEICSIWCVYRDNPEQLKQELSPDDYGSIFEELKDSLLFLDWGGGEPYLRNDMCEILTSAASTCPKLSSFVITTNGLLTDRIEAWTEELAANLPEHRLSIGVSLDGDEETHNRMRGRDNAFSSATDTIRRLQAVRKKHKNVEVKISYTISSLNAGRFGQFHDEVLRSLDLQAGDVGFNLEHTGLLFQTQKAGQETVGAIAGEQYREAVAKDIEFAVEHIRKEKLPLIQRLKSFYRLFFLERIPPYLAAPDKMVIPCKAAENSIYLDPYGNIYPCVVWDKKLGNCRDGILNVLASERASAARKAVMKAKCPVCWTACEVIPSILTSWRLVGCVARSLVGR